MINKEFEDNLEEIKSWSFIKQSTYRYKVIDYLNTHRIGTPKEIAIATSIRPNHISKVLADLKRAEVIICINPEVRKGRLYTLTEYGDKVIRVKEKLNL